MAAESVQGIIGVAIFGTSLVLAAFVYLARPQRTQNRLLALFLILEGLHLGFVGLTRVATDPITAAAADVASGVPAAPGLLAYLLFLATLPGAFAAVLRPRWLQWSLAAVTAAWTAWVVADPAAALAWWPVLQVVAGLVFLYGLLVAVGFHRATRPDTPARSQARAYLLAFGLRDAIVAPALIVFAIAPASLAAVLLDWSFFAVIPVFHALLAFGILKTHLFDIDLKLKWTLEKGTVAAIFVAVFFVVSEGAQVLFAGFAESEILGILAAGALVFLLAPLQRLAGRLGDAAMPGVEDTPEYRARRKRAVYRASLDELLADGKITAKERRMLARLQEELGLEGGEANRIEADVLDALGGGS